MTVCIAYLCLRTTYIGPLHTSSFRCGIPALIRANRDRRANCFRGLLKLLEIKIDLPYLVLLGKSFIKFHSSRGLQPVAIDVILIIQNFLQTAKP
jgi:hypothetical protein